MSLIISRVIVASTARPNIHRVGPGSLTAIPANRNIAPDIRPTVMLPEIPAAFSPFSYAISRIIPINAITKGILFSRAKRSIRSPEPRSACAHTEAVSAEMDPEGIGRSG